MPGFSQSINLAAPSTRLWALVPGLRELMLVGLVVVALYGRTTKLGKARRRLPRAWFVRPRVRTQPRALRWIVDRWMLVFALLAGAGVVAWVATSSWVIRSWALP